VDSFLKYFAKFIFSPFSLQFIVLIQKFILIIFQTLSLREEKERESSKYKSREKKSLIVRILTTKNLILSVNEFYMARGVH
jgi:hypothetical protein